MRTSVVLAAWVILQAGCGGSSTPPPEVAKTGQSFEQAIEMLCNVDQLAGFDPESDILAVGKQRSAWVADKIENPDGIFFCTMISVKGADEQAAAIREKATEIGLKQCALADSLDAYSAGGLSPEF